MKADLHQFCSCHNRFYACREVFNEFFLSGSPA